MLTYVFCLNSSPNSSPLIQYIWKNSITEQKIFFLILAFIIAIAMSISQQDYNAT